MRYSLKQFITAMKKAFLFFGLALLSNGSALFAQSTATTTPVGFISETVVGGTLASPKLTLLSPTLTRPVSFQGTISAISGTTITVSGASWTNGQFNGVNGEYYVEIFSATKPGVLSDITATGATTVTTADNLTAFATVGDFIAIRKHVTIADLLGANNSYGLLGSDDASTADEVLVYDGANHATYFYFNGAGAPAGWYDLSFNPAGNAVISPHEGVVIKRKAAGNVTIVSTGTVKAGNTLFPIYNGLNVVGTVSAQGLTLDSSNLYLSNGTALHGSDDASTADEVIIYSGTGQANYFYFNGAGAPAGWYDLSFNPAGSVAIAPGSAFVVNRKGGGAFNWVLPAPTTF
jgi:uncharacterized protein (TIGR02597 family)